MNAPRSAFLAILTTAVVCGVVAPVVPAGAVPRGQFSAAALAGQIYQPPAITPDGPAGIASYGDASPVPGGTPIPGVDE